MGAQRLASRVRKKALVEPHAFLAISTPDGDLKYYTSQSIKDNELARHQRDAFIGAVSLIAKEERIRGRIDRRAEMAARKLVNNRMELAASKHVTPSKQWRQYARQASQRISSPQMQGYRCVLMSSMNGSSALWDLTAQHARQAAVAAMHVRHMLGLMIWRVSIH